MRWHFVLLSSILIGICAAQSTVAEQHLDQLLERWRWMNYWEGSTEIPGGYHVGQHLQILLFWSIDEKTTTVGFCSQDLGFCQFYPDLSAIRPHFEIPMNPGDTNVSAFERFRENSFGQYDSPIWQGRSRSRAPRAQDFETAIVDTVLLELDPPVAIRKRMPRPRPEIEELVSHLGCAGGSTGCKIHLLIPFYGENDLSVPVYRECASDCTDAYPPAILYPQKVEGIWWLGATAVDLDTATVKHVRQQIERALMTEVGR